MQRLASFVPLYLVATSVAGGGGIRLTVYDDGLSCPSDCDAHVVFNSVLNGTEFAHDPKTPSMPFAKCIAGQNCRLCLESGGKQCLGVVYRGGGPPANTFDFTPAFYQAVCMKPPSQPLLAAKCSILRKAAEKLEGRTNCIVTPDDPSCSVTMRRAALARTADRVEYSKCLALGEAKYNSATNVSNRSVACAYELNGTGGPNSRGIRWRKLLPGACRDGTFVGQDGLDCCTGIALTDGQFGKECLSFYVTTSSK